MRARSLKRQREDAALDDRPEFRALFIGAFCWLCLWEQHKPAPEQGTDVHHLFGRPNLPERHHRTGLFLGCRDHHERIVDYPLSVLVACKKRFDPWGWCEDVAARLWHGKTGRIDKPWEEPMSREELTIDEEFRDLCPPLERDERDRLRQNILADGCRDPIVCWGDIIVDGHNRYAICNEEDKPYKVHRLKFQDRNEAINWIIDNQLGRRNISVQQRTYLLGRRYNSDKGQQGGDQKSHESQEKSKGQVATLIAEQHDVDPSTVKRAGEFAAAVDAIGEKSPEVAKAIKAGTIKAPAATVKAIAKSPAAIKKAAAEVQKGAAKLTAPAEPKNGAATFDPEELPQAWKKLSRGLDDMVNAVKGACERRGKAKGKNPRDVLAALDRANSESRKHFEVAHKIYKEWFRS